MFFIVFFHVYAVFVRHRSEKVISDVKKKWKIWNRRWDICYL